RTQVHPNPKFAPDKTAYFTNLYGKRIARRYYRGPKPEGDLRGNRHGERYFFEGALDDQKFRWVRRAINDLANAYRSTNREKYARRALFLLDAFGHKYRHYLSHEGRGINGYYINTKKRERNAADNGWVTDEREAPFSWSAGRLLKWWGGEMLRDVIPAYAALRKSRAMEALSKEKGYDVAKHIDDHVLREMADYVLLIPWKSHMANNLSNMFVQLAEIGATVGEPEYVHKVYKYCNTVMESYEKEHGRAGYSYDLHNSEGAQGHYGVMSRIHSVFKSIEGYSDPEGYVGREDGLHFDDLSLDEVMPLFDASIYAPEAYCLPNGALSPTHDTVGYHPTGRRGTQLTIAPLTESRNRLLPGFGHAVLGAGKGERQSQVHLRFSTQDANHTHHDNLGLVWFAHGRELSGDIGYQRNKLRFWSASTMSHNTVVVDRSEQKGSKPVGNLLFFEALPGLSMVQVDSTSFYKHAGVTRYRRTVIHNTAETDRPYFVDVFEVAGGKVHDYAIHGSVLGDQVGASSLRLESTPKVLSKDGNTYKLFRNVISAPAEGDYSVTFTDKGDRRVGTRIHLFGDPAATVLLGESPALRPVGHYSDKDVLKYGMPHLIVRRDDGSPSVFAAVYDMFGDGPQIAKVERLTGGEGELALRIVFTGGRTDTVLLSLTGPRRMSRAGVAMNGTLGCVVSMKGKTELHLIEGTELEAAGNRLEQDAAAFAGHVTGGERVHSGGAANCFVTDASLPEERALDGKWLILEHGDGETTNGHQIDRVERNGGACVIHLKRDHGMTFANGVATERLSPWREFAKPERFVIRRSLSTVPDARKGPAGDGPPAGSEPVKLVEAKLGLRFRADDGEGNGSTSIVPNFVALRMGEYSGYVLVPTDGVYTFSVEANHEAALEVAGRELVDMKGLGPYRVWKAGISLRAGFHPIRVWYRPPKRGRSSLTVRYSGPGIERQRVPDWALFQ
ncbi:MAG: PA14 domain-containing protein, partial [Planctomycetota bacterium]